MDSYFAKELVEYFEAAGAGKHLDEVIDHFADQGKVIGLTMADEHNVIASMKDDTYVFMSEDVESKNLSFVGSMESLNEVADYMRAKGLWGAWEAMTQDPGEEGIMLLRIDHAFGDGGSHGTVH